jgi:23S rRNA A2030 N6-methylase RlmJ
MAFFFQSLQGAGEHPPSVTFSQVSCIRLSVLSYTFTEHQGKSGTKILEPPFELQQSHLTAHFDYMKHCLSDEFLLPTSTWS